MLQRKDIRVYLAFEALVFVAIKVAEFTMPVQLTKCIMYSAILGNTVMGVHLFWRYGFSPSYRHEALIFCALLVNCVADIFLTLTGGENMYIPGFACFCTVEIIYAAYLRPDFRNLCVRAALLAVALLFAWSVHLLTFPNALGLFNLTLVGANAVCAWLARRTDRTFAALLFAFGLTCFFIGDISVALEIMLPAGTPAQWAAKLAVWTFYVPAQVLIVLSYAERIRV
ncbi:MAG: hypothetical protein IKR84_07600 [Oscillibacter sp.]|nr:hypothetical protein [Oscillibacter sp.]